jgi:para-aminobenzoate synthetase / 4-amino-4-deoxychorismate lyase
VDPRQLAAALGEVERAVEERGLRAVGFLTYEAGGAFGLPVRSGSGLPLLWFGLHAAVEEVGPPELTGPGSSVEWAPALDLGAYSRAVRRIQDHIAAGDTYQVNFTFPLRGRLADDPWDLFAAGAAVQRAAHAAYLDLGRLVVASLSPELFFRLDGDRLNTRPMKGTAARGPTPARDDGQAEWLRGSEKNRAENLMIVDMVRNDLGRVASVGSVLTRSLFDVERYPTLLQMTSSVEARSAAPLAAIVAALFPCASVTGAPKHRTMELIADLEPEPRGLYTGAVGFLSPGRRASFAVAIRTVVVDREAGDARYGVGSGIVADSVAEEEYAECLLKARVLSERPFRLLETLRYTPDEGYWLLEEHLARLAASARHFGADSRIVERSRAALRDAASAFRAPRRVRLLVDLDGRPEVESTALPEAQAVRLALAPRPVDRDLPWLYHKTTRREAYDEVRRAAPEADDVVLWNDRGEVTETTTANVVVDLPEGPCTPPVECGLLPGTFRARLIAEGAIRERVLRLEDLGRGRIRLVNAVRGWQDGLLMTRDVAPGDVRPR